MRYVGYAVATLCSSALVLTGTAVLAAGPAYADCSGAGDFGAGSGCPPPGDTSGSGGSGEAWPPTSVDWPPSQSSTSSDGAGGGGKSAPIVLPDGQTAPSRPAHTVDSSSTSTSTSTPPTPIVPAGAASTGPSTGPSTDAPTTVIVAPAAAH